MSVDQDTRQEIQGHVNRLQKYWTPRNTRFQLDRDMYNLVEPVWKKGIEQVTLNSPKILWDTVVAMLVSGNLRFQLPIEINYTQDQKNKMNKVERLCVGILNELNERQHDRGGNDWLYELAFWVCSGWYAIFPWIYEDDDGEIAMRADLFDPYYVYPEWGANRLIRCARVYPTTAAHVRSMCEENGWEWDSPAKNDDEVEVKDYWVEDKEGIGNCVYVGNDFIKEPEYYDEFSSIPVKIKPVGGSPFRGMNKDWQNQVGESIIGTNRGMYEQQNRWISLMMQVVADTAYPPIIEKTRGGIKKVKAQDLGPGTKHTYDLDEGMEILKYASTPMETNQLLATFGQLIQQGGLPNTIYGNLGFEVSGYALSQLLSAIRYKINPYLISFQYAIGSTMSELLRQFKAGKHTITLATSNPKRLGKGAFYVEEFRYKDIPDVSHINVSISIGTAQDKVQQIITAKNAITDPQLLSRETLWEDYLDVDDTQVEYQRIISDQTNNLPIVKMIAVMEDLKTRIAEARAANNTIVADALTRYLQMMEMQYGMRQSMLEVPGKQMGISPGTMPPEASGISPDVVSAMMNRAPSGVNRRAQTNEERATTQHQLFGPNGEPLR